jgi:Mn-containing catalase
MQGDLRFTHTYFKMSSGEEGRGPWNKGKGPWEKGEQWEYVEDPVAQVKETAGQANKEITGHERDPDAVQTFERELAVQRSGEVKAGSADGERAW